MTRLVPCVWQKHAPVAAWPEAATGARGERALQLLCCLWLCASGCSDAKQALAASQGTEVPIATRDDAGHARSDEPDAGAPAARDEDDVARSCPVRITVATRSYGSGDEAQDDYAPRNVGAIWISTSADNRFVRTVAAWGPTYFDHALTWIEQSEGSLVDAVTLPTRSTHMRPVEVSWDCRDEKQQLVAAGSYRVNLEFTEAEMQGPVLAGERALALELGAGAKELVRAPMGFWGEIRVTAGKP